MKSEINEYKIMNERILELEKKAERLYLEHSEWEYIIEMLDEEERKEYFALMKKYNQLMRYFDKQWVIPRKEDD